MQQVGGGSSKGNAMAGGVEVIDTFNICLFVCSLRYNRPDCRHWLNKQQHRTAVADTRDVGAAQGDSGRKVGVV